MAILALLFPIIALVLALTKKRKYWKYAIAFALLCVPILINTIHATATCTGGGFCGLGTGLLGFLLILVLGIIAIVLSLINSSKK